MRSVVVIPARYASVRFPGKPLADATGRYLIQHVYEQALLASRPERVLVATDDVRIEAACRAFGADVRMTPSDCPSGTDRVARAVKGIDCDVVVNVQGDEPELDPNQIDALIALMETGADMATLAVRDHDPDRFSDPNAVKVVLDGEGRALLFTRAPVPYVRDSRGGMPEDGFLRHLGIYAYRREFLETYAAATPTRLEQLERLEQLRALEGGFEIRVGIVDHAAPGIDTPEQYEAFCWRYRQRGNAAGSAESEPVASPNPELEADA